MSVKKYLRFLLIKFNRYILRRRFMPVMAGPLKGFYWSTTSNYDYLTGEYEDAAVIKSFLSWLHPRSVFFDIGANVGYYAFLASARITDGVIYSFEPMPDNIAVFKKHLSLNAGRLGDHHIVLQPYAISDTEKEVAFSNDEPGIEGNTYVADAPRLRNAAATLKVKSYSIDGLVQNGLQIPDVIKIDVEGAEYDVLMGGLQTIKSHKPNILLATHDAHLAGVQQKCVDLLKSLGYNLRHTGYFNKHLAGHDDYIAIHKDKA